MSKIIIQTAIQIQESAILKDGHLKELIPKSKKSITAPQNILSIRLPIPPEIIRQNEYRHNKLIFSHDLERNKIIKIKIKNIPKENIKFCPCNMLKAVPVFLTFTRLKKSKKGIIFIKSSQPIKILTRYFVI
jgi:hypothetical protein